MMPAPTTIATLAGVFAVVSTDCWFEIDGVPSSTTAWECSTPMALLRPPPLRNGGGLVVPRAHGRIPRRRWRDVTETVLSFSVFADYAPDGTVYPDPSAGLVANLMFLRSHLGLPANTSSTRSVKVNMPDGLTWSGTVQCEVDWSDEAAPPVANAAVSVTVFSMEQDVP